MCSDDTGREVACRTPYGIWFAADQCYVLLADPQPPMTDLVWQGHTTGAVYDCTSVGATTSYLPETVPLWLAEDPTAPPVDFTVLRQQAYDQTGFVQPDISRYPAGTLTDGSHQPYALVRAPNWVWAQPTQWHPFTHRSYQGSAWAQATVTPATITITPGTGGPPVTCTGPGTVWSEATYGPYVASPSGCDITYQRASTTDSDLVTATYTVTWTATWTTSADTSGTYPAPTTQSTQTYLIAQAQTVITR